MEWKLFVCYCISLIISLFILSSACDGINASLYVQYYNYPLAAIIVRCEVVVLTTKKCTHVAHNTLCHFWLTILNLQSH